MIDLEKEINDVLFKMGKDIRLYKIDNDNSVIEIDYDKYTAEILKIFRDYLSE